MLFTVVQIFDSYVILKPHANAQNFNYDIIYIFSPAYQPITSSMLSLGDTLRSDINNYMHMIQFTSNRLYETQLYLQSASKPWLTWNFPYIRPFDAVGNNFNYVFGIKLIEYTVLYRTQKLFTRIRNMAPETEEILNYFLTKMNNLSVNDVMADCFIYPECVLTIVNACLFRVNNDLKKLAENLKIKLVFMIAPNYDFNLTNPKGEIEFTFTLKGDQYEILYTLQEKTLFEAPSAVKFIENFNRTYQEGFNTDDSTENLRESKKKLENSKKIINYCLRSYIFQLKDRAMPLIRRAACFGLITPDVGELIRKLSCIMCQTMENLFELECSDKICMNCFTQLICDSTNGLYVLNEIEPQVKIFCPGCNGVISAEFIQVNLPYYEYYAQLASERITFSCQFCRERGKLDVFLTDCRHICSSCTIDSFRDGAINCGYCNAQFSPETIKKFMGLSATCQGCESTLNWVRCFSRKLCQHLLCFECLKGIENTQQCFWDCPNFNLSRAEFRNLFIIKCYNCINIFDCSIKYWRLKSCQCKICMICMLAQGKFESCVKCGTESSEEFVRFLITELQEKRQRDAFKIQCPVCTNSKPIDDFLDLFNCGCQICRECLETNIKFLLSDISYFDKISSCPKCDKTVDDGQLENLMSLEDWDKFCAFKYQQSVGSFETCPKCHLQFEPGITRKVICPFKDCGFQYCKRCKAAFHKDGDCEEVFIQQQIEILKNEEGGVTQCPRCRVPYIKNQGTCEHVTCLTSGCGIDFCFQCACIRSPALEHGNHYHRPDCKFFNLYDGDDRYLEKCSECKKLRKLCKPPKKLRKARLVAKDEVE